MKIGIIGKNTMILPLQNGLSAIDELKERISADRFIGGLCRIMSKIESPGVINHFGVEPVITFGEIESDFVKQSVCLIDSYPYNSTASLTRDVWNGKPSEIEYQNGTVVKLAKKNLTNAPINEFVYNCILPMEIKARKKC
jgi:ketopantoate reductase